VQRLTHAWLAAVAAVCAGEPERMRTSVVEGLPGPSIGSEADGPADVVVIGRHGADSPSPGGLGSTTRLVLSSAPGAVLVVPTADACVPSLNLLADEPGRRPPAEPLSVA
jgi:nucleotide-binding universal stress UspA family protein